MGNSKIRPPTRSSNWLTIPSLLARPWISKAVPIKRTSISIFSSPLRRLRFFIAGCDQQAENRAKGTHDEEGEQRCLSLGYRYDWAEIRVKARRVPAPFR